MLIDIRPLREDAARSFSGKADLGHLRLWGEQIFPEPVEIQGCLTLRHRQVIVDYTVGYTLSCRCARRLAAACQNGKLRFSHPVEESPDENAGEDIIAAPGGMLDMAELAGADLLLEFTRPLLCKEDCKGICPECGSDQNMAECGCANKKKVDPRFAALLDYIE